MPADRTSPLLVVDGGAFVTIDAVEPTGRGALDGWDVATKDMIAVAGRASSVGIAPPLVERADADATVVAALRAAGARIVGTTAMHQLACGVTGVNDTQGTPSNPRWPDRIPGGSSSGSAAAVAGGVVRAAIGTDTGGSVRIPAACCGVVGVKPSRGALPLDGVFPCAPSLDHLGVLTSSVADAATLLSVLGVDVGTGHRPSELVVGLPAGAGAFDDAVERAVLAALVGPGIRIVPVTLPDPERVARTSTEVLLGEFARVHRDLGELHRAGLGADIVDRLDAGNRIDDAELDAARRELDVLRAELSAVLESVDVISLATLPRVVPTLNEAREHPTGTGQMLVANTRLANCAGLPAASLPVGGGRPIGLQLVAATDADLMVAAAMLAA